MDQLKDILSNRFDEPAEMARIKKFVRDNFKVEVGVTVRDKDIVILASSAALAGTLRLHFTSLQEASRTDKRLIIRIGV